MKDESGEIEDAETRERRELRGKSRVSDFVTAALTGRSVGGASAEYSDAVGCPGLMPLDLLDSPEPEERAVTPGPAAETVTSTRPTVPHAFARTDAAALGIAMPMVASGEAHFPALTTAPPAGPKAKDAAADSTAAAFSLTKRTPGRITGQFLIRLEDLALMPSMEQDLRMGISGAMADNLDDQVIGGSGASPNLDGLLKQATDVAASGAVETFATGVARFAALVDGKHANGWGDIRALIGTATFAKYAALFHGDSGEMSLYDYFEGQAGRATGVYPRARRCFEGAAGHCPTDGADAARGGPGVAWRGNDRRPFHAGREGPAGRDGGNPCGLAIHSARDRAGRRGPPQAELGGWSPMRPVELRNAGRTLYGTLVQEGRAASGGRAEVFAPGSVEWPSTGVGILLDHRQAPEVRAVPERQRDGRITVEARATGPIRQAVESGKRFMSVEFHALRERTTEGGVREIQRALVPDAALVSRPEYDVSDAEVRRRGGGRMSSRVRTNRRMDCKCPGGGCKTIRFRERAFVDIGPDSVVATTGSLDQIVGTAVLSPSTSGLVIATSLLETQAAADLAILLGAGVSIYARPLLDLEASETEEGEDRAAGGGTLVVRKAVFGAILYKVVSPAPAGLDPVTLSREGRSPRVETETRVAVWSPVQPTRRRIWL